MNRARRLLAFLLATLLLPVVSARASGIGSHRQVLDFTKSEEVRGRAIWSPADRLDLTDGGLGWDGAPNSCYDGWVQTSEPMAVGTSWRPARSASIRVSIHRDREWRTPEGLTIRVMGTLYARYSPDATHWSDWQQLSRAESDGEEERLVHHGFLSVPRRQSEPYDALVREYARRDVPWKSDEEAAVRWILEKDPEFLARTLPFVGYVQLLYETSIYGGHRIRKVVLDASYVIPGVHHSPKLKEAAAGRWNSPWRFRSLTDPEFEEPDWTHVTDDGRLHVASDAADESLDLEGTAVTDAGLAPVAGLEELRALKLRATAVTDSGLEHIADLAKLESLDLSRTETTDAGFANLRGLTALRTLNLAQTGLTDRGVSFLDRLTALEDLDLLGTRITSKGLETVGRLTKLRALCLWSTRVTDEGLAHLRGLKDLRSLSLGGGGPGVTDAGVRHLAALERLEELVLSGTRITDAALPILGKTTALKHLSLNGTEVTDAGLEHLKRLAGLKSLRIAGTDVTDAGLVHLRKLRSLEVLWLHDTRITDAGLAHLRGLTDLRELTVSGTAVTDAAVEKLKRALPKLKTIW
jgi:hypothetical protein